MRVFVSSTYFGLKDHRAAVEEVLKRLGLSFSVMEYFGAREDEPCEASLSEIARCDLVIGIYAHRYGSVPLISNRSITEQEYDFARQKGLPVLCYIVDPDYPWDSQFVDQDPRLEKFLKRVKKEVVFCPFTSPDDLGKKVAADLGRRLAKQDKAVSGIIVKSVLGAFDGGSFSIIGRAHLLKLMLESPKFYSSYLPQHQTGRDQIMRYLNVLLEKIKHTPKKPKPVLSSTAQQVISRAEELMLSGLQASLGDCLWQGLAEDHAKKLSLVHDRSTADQHWLTFVRDAGLSSVLQLATPYWTEESEL